MKRFPLLALSISLSLLSSTALCQERAACFQAASEGQTLRDQHKLLEAREQFRICAQKACPVSMQTDCASWLDAADRDLPSVVLSAKDASGGDALDVTVTLDAASTPTPLDGRALSLDPGLHIFHFERQGGRSVELRVLLREGEKARSVSAVFAEPAPPKKADVALEPPEPAARKPSLLGPVIGASGLALVVSGVVFVVVGGSHRSQCDSDGACPSPAALERYNQGTPLLNTGYALLALGSAATVTGAVLWLSDSREGARRTGGASVKLALGPSGVSLSGGF